MNQSSVQNDAGPCTRPVAYTPSFSSLIWFCVLVPFCIYIGVSPGGQIGGAFPPLVWPMLGLYFAFAVSTDRLYWPTLAVAALVTQSAFYQVTRGTVMATDMISWAANTYSAFLGAIALSYWPKRAKADPYGFCDTLAVIALGGLFVPMVNATILHLASEFLPAAQDHWPNWFEVFGIDSLGVITTAPLVITLFASDAWRRPRRFVASLGWASVLPVLLAGATFMVFCRTDLPEALRQPYLLFPLAIFIAMQGRPGVTASANFLLGIIAIRATLVGLGPLATHLLSNTHPVNEVQIFVLVTVLLTTLMTRAVGALSAENAARRDAEERLELAMSAADLGVFEHTDRIQQNLSKSMGDLLGLPSRHPISTSLIRSRIDPRDRDRILRAMADLESGSICVFNDRFRVNPTSEQSRWVALHAKSSPVKGQRRRRVVGTLKDITDEMTACDALQEANAAATAASQAKSRFLAAISHELRTPLGAMIGFADLQCEPRTSEAERLGFAHIIKRNGLHMSQLIDQLLDLSKVEAGRLETLIRPVVVRELVEDLISSFRLKAQEKGLDLRHQIATNIPYVVDTDAMRLRQVLLNALGNAVKFTGAGHVHLRMHGQPQDDGTFRLIFDVVDSGIGLSPDEAARLFQPFAQANNHIASSFGGTGLGLVLSRRIASILGGSFDLIDSAKGVGSTFRLTLQVAYRTASEERLVAKPAETPPAPSQPLAGLRLLLADDFADSRQLIARYLRLDGATVDEAENGLQAVEGALANSYHVVLMDMQMPVMDGREATASLRARAYAVPILALTAHSMHDEVAEILASGFTGHLGKPVTRAQLNAKIGEVAVR